MKIKIKKTVGVEEKDIFTKEYNLWLGISLDNKWFNKENIFRLIDFGLEYTKETLLILVPGRMQATNFMYFNKMRRARALKKAFDEEAKKLKEINQIVGTLDDNKKKKIIIADYDDICSTNHIKQREVLFREFAEQGLFYKKIISIAKNTLIKRGRTITVDRAEGVALYVLLELPMFIDGVKSLDTGEVHSVILYPGLGEMNDLIVSIRESEDFSSLRQKLEIKNKTGFVDVR